MRRAGGQRAALSKRSRDAIRRATRRTALQRHPSSPFTAGIARSGHRSVAHKSSPRPGRSRAMSLPFLKTKNLDLRPLEPSDADGPYLQWFNDPEVCRTNSHFVFPYRREDAIAYIQSVNSSRTDLVLAIMERDRSRHIGNIALSGMDPVHRSGEFSIV